MHMVETILVLRRSLIVSTRNQAHPAAAKRDPSESRRAERRAGRLRNAGWLPETDTNADAVEKRWRCRTCADERSGIWRVLQVAANQRHAAQLQGEHASPADVRYRVGKATRTDVGHGLPRAKRCSHEKDGGEYTQL